MISNCIILQILKKTNDKSKASTEQNEAGGSKPSPQLRNHGRQLVLIIFQSTKGSKAKSERAKTFGNQGWRTEARSRPPPPSRGPVVLRPEEDSAPSGPFAGVRTVLRTDRHKETDAGGVRFPLRLP